MSTYKAQNMEIRFPIVIFLFQIHAWHVPHFSAEVQDQSPKSHCCLTMIDCCLLWANISNELYTASVLQACRLLSIK